MQFKLKFNSNQIYYQIPGIQKKTSFTGLNTTLRSASIIQSLLSEIYLPFPQYTCMPPDISQKEISS